MFFSKAGNSGRFYEPPDTVRQCIWVERNSRSVYHGQLTDWPAVVPAGDELIGFSMSDVAQSCECCIVLSLIHHMFYSVNSFSDCFHCSCRRRFNVQVIYRFELVEFIAQFFFLE